MSNPEQNNNQELPPIIPSWAILAVAGIALVVFLGALLFQGQIVLTIGSGAVAAIMIFVWMMLFPSEVLDLVRGRTFLYGASGALVVVLLFVAAGLVYNLVKSRNLSYDFSNRDVYSLDEEVREVLGQMATDPTVPSVYILGFYSVAQASERDRVEVLFNDMVSASGGKILGYQIIDPNIEPVRTQLYLNPDNAATPPTTPAIVVAGVNPETGQASEENFETAFTGQTRIDAQFNIINSMLKLGVSGDFRAYFLSTDGGIDVEASGNFGGNGFIGDLEDEADWDIEQISPLEIVGASPAVTLNDPTANAEIIVMAGGTEPLTDEALTALQNYTANGGDLVILADINTQGGVPTALSENMSNFLWENYGVRFRSDLVLDPEQTLSRDDIIFANSYGTHPITTAFTADDLLVFEAAHSIEISSTPPSTVLITPLVNTSATAYAKANFDFSSDISSNDLQQVDGDLTGAIPLAVAVENTTTGSRLVLVSSDALLLNSYRGYREISSPEFVLAAVSWASEARDFASTIRNIVPEPPTQDTPVYVRPDHSWMGLVAILGLPGLLLAIGILVWFVQRPKAIN